MAIAEASFKATGIEALIEANREIVSKEIPNANHDDDTLAAYTAALSFSWQDSLDWSFNPSDFVKFIQRKVQNVPGSGGWSDKTEAFYTLAASSMLDTNEMQEAIEYANRIGGNRTNATRPLYAAALSLAGPKRLAFYENQLNDLGWCNATPEAHAAHLLALTILKGDVDLLSQAADISSNIKGYNSTKNTRALYTLAVACELTKHH